MVPYVENKGLNKLETIWIDKTVSLLFYKESKVYLANYLDHKCTPKL